MLRIVGRIGQAIGHGVVQGDIANTARVEMTQPIEVVADCSTVFHTESKAKLAGRLCRPRLIGVAHEDELPGVATDLSLTTVDHLCGVRAVTSTGHPGPRRVQ